MKPQPRACTQHHCLREVHACCFCCCSFCREVLRRGHALAFAWYVCLRMFLGQRSDLAGIAKQHDPTLRWSGLFDCSDRTSVNLGGEHGGCTCASCDSRCPRHLRERCLSVFCDMYVVLLFPLVFTTRSNAVHVWSEWYGAAWMSREILRTSEFSTCWC
jgi:hypothetical protein